jgi:hypothetical protein
VKLVPGLKQTANNKSPEVMLIEAVLPAPAGAADGSGNLRTKQAVSHAYVRHAYVRGRFKTYNG